MDAPVAMNPVHRWFDIAFGLAVMGTVGALIGIIMGGGLMPIAIMVGLGMGGVIGFLGGRRFLVSILIGSVLCRDWSGHGLISGRADLDAFGCACREKGLVPAG
jgi:hypothetical protein